MAMAKQLVMLRKAAPSLCMSRKISPEGAVLVFAGAQINLVVADAGLLRVAGPAVGQPAAAGDVAVHDLLGNLHRLGCREASA